MKVVITNDSCYSLNPKCFGVPVEAIQTRANGVVKISRLELIRIGAIPENSAIDDSGFNFLMDFEVRRV